LVNLPALGIGGGVACFQRDHMIKIANRLGQLAASLMRLGQRPIRGRRLRIQFHNLLTISDRRVELLGLQAHNRALRIGIFVSRVERDRRAEAGLGVRQIIVLQEQCAEPQMRRGQPGIERHRLLIIGLGARGIATALVVRATLPIQRGVLPIQDDPLIEIAQRADEVAVLLAHRRPRKECLAISRIQLERAVEICRSGLPLLQRRICAPTANVPGCFARSARDRRTEIAQRIA